MDYYPLFEDQNVAFAVTTIDALPHWCYDIIGWVIGMAFGLLEVII